MVLKNSQAINNKVKIKIITTINHNENQIHNEITGKTTTEEDVIQENKMKITIKKIVNSGLLLWGIALLFSCNANRVYEEYTLTGNNGWNKDSVVTFNFNIENTKEDYSLYINSRNIENYPYSNLWLFVNITSPDSISIKDTVNFQLAEPNGKWLGKGTSGVYTNQFMYRSNIYFPVEGNYEITFQQAMRDNILKGLREVGIRVEKVN